MAEKKRFQLSLRTRLLIAAPICLVVGLSLVPPRLGALNTEYPAFDDLSHRKKTTGTSLDSAAAIVNQEDIEFPSSIPEKGIAKLRGTLSLPNIPGPRPAVILLHGSGPSSRQGALPGDLVSKMNPPFELLRELADFFAHEGLVVLRWDKRGPGQYPELAAHRAEFRFADFERDARDAIAYLATRPEVDSQAIVVAGHSEGGAIAPHVAALERTRVAATILLSGFMDTFDGAAWQTANYAHVRLRQGDVIGYASLGIMANVARKCIAKLSTDFDPNEECLGKGTTQAAVKDNADYEVDTIDKLQSLETPIFAIQGSVDRNVDPDTLPRLGRLLGGSDIELHYVPRLNHLLVDVIDGPKQAAFDPQVKDRLRAFLASVRR